MRVKIYYSGKKSELDVKKTGFFSKGIGLMFKTKNTNNLVFEFNEDVSISIHSFFVFFPFLAVWLDSKNNVLECRIVKPFCFYAKPKLEFRKLIEIPLNLRNEKIIKFFTKKDRLL